MQHFQKCGSRKMEGSSELAPMNSYYFTIVGTFCSAITSVSYGTMPLLLVDTVKYYNHFLETVIKRVKGSFCIELTLKPVSRKSRNFTGHFRVSQFPLYLKNGENLSRQPSQSVCF